MVVREVDVCVAVVRFHTGLRIYWFIWSEKLKKKYTQYTKKSE